MTGVETIELIDPRKPRKDLSKLEAYRGQELSAKEILRILGYHPLTAFQDPRVSGPVVGARHPLKGQKISLREVKGFRPTRYLIE